MPEAERREPTESSLSPEQFARSFKLEWELSPQRLSRIKGKIEAIKSHGFTGYGGVFSSKKVVLGDKLYQKTHNHSNPKDILTFGILVNYIVNEYKIFTANNTLSLNSFNKLFGVNYNQAELKRFRDEIFAIVLEEIEKVLNGKYDKQQT